MIHKIQYSNGPVWIEDEQIKTKIVPANIRHYSQFYEDLHIGQDVHVNVLFLPPKSNVKITAVCPMCEEKRVTAKSNVIESGHSYCQKCRQRLSAYQKYIGQKFGRLTITGFGPSVPTKEGGNLTTLQGVCDCGNTITVYGQTVARAERKGRIMSCGCYAIEKAKETGMANTGSNNGMYRHDMSDQDRENLVKRRKIQKAKNWSKAIRSRDLRCVICNSEKPLIAHHLYSYRFDKSLRYNLMNGVTLCQTCHEQFHYGYMHNTTQYCTAADFYNYIQDIHGWTQAAIEQLKASKNLLS